MRLVVISQNQSSHIPQILSKTNIITDRLIVLDRCTDNSIDVCKALRVNYITTPTTLQGFQAGYARNLGVDNYSGDVIFLDGDRVPVHEFDDDLLTSLKRYDTCLFPVKNDIRSTIHSTQFIDNPKHGLMSNDFFSCGLYLSLKSLQTIREFQGFIFDPEFNGKWGDEDCALGDVCYDRGLSCGLVPMHYCLSGSFDGLDGRVKTDEYALQCRLRFMKRMKLNVLWTDFNAKYKTNIK